MIVLTNSQFGLFPLTGFSETDAIVVVFKLSLNIQNFYCRYNIFNCSSCNIFIMPKFNRIEFSSFLQNKVVYFIFAWRLVFLLLIRRQGLEINRYTFENTRITEIVFRFVCYEWHLENKIYSRRSGRRMQINVKASGKY